MKHFSIYYMVLICCFIFYKTETIAQNQESNEPIADIKNFCSSQKGFNLLGKFDVNWSNSGFREKEFEVINQLGFNFVRLPVDYRTYTLAGNWNNFVESQVKNIDDAISWGEKYNVHVSLNLHRAPGYCVNSTTNLPANQQLDLWTDTVAQNVFVNHWLFFTERYKEVSPARLSFNLVNEPSNVSEANYVAVMKKAIDAIHNITPERLIFVDGLNYAGEIILSLKDEPNVAQALHSYQPFRLTHYKAGWVNGSDTWPVPKWPILAINNYLYGSWKSDLKSPLVLLGDFKAGMEIIVNVHKVSVKSTFHIKANNQTIYSKEFVCSATPGNDFTEVVNTEWGYQNISNKNFSVVLQNQASKLSFENGTGDWMTLNSISIKTGNDTTEYFLGDNSWGKKQSTYIIEENGEIKTEDGRALLPFDDYETNFTRAKENNIPFMIQEFGVHNQTPHTTTLAFLSDLIDFFNEHKVGWALWNLEGSFGILNSSRSDCVYESYNGYQLDRQMLEVLRKLPTLSQPVRAGTLLKIYPSPAKNELVVTGEDLTGNVDIKIFSVSGSLVKQVLAVPVDYGSVKIDLTDIKSNLYILFVQNNKNIFTEKILIKK